MRRATAIVLVGISVGATLAAQQWHAEGPDARQGLSLCYDPVRRVMVAFGGGALTAASIVNHRATWEWSGSGWSRRMNSFFVPSGRTGAAFAYDPVRGVCLLFGGYSPTSPTDTWQWDGVSWTQLVPANAPPFASRYWLAFDPLRSRLVLSPSSGATWEWDGSNWLQVGSGTNPGYYCPLVWDSVRGKIASFADNRHWEWDGVTWSVVATTPVPSRHGHSLTWDSVHQRLCVFGGDLAVGGPANDLWVGSGTSWQQLPAAPSMPGRRYHAAAFDEHRGRLVVHGGWGEGGMLNDTWEHDGTQWFAAAATPLPAVDHALAADPATGRMLLHAHVYPDSQTYERIAGVWSKRSPTVAPPAVDAGLAFDPLRGTFLHFGGNAAGTPSPAFHEWTGTDWQPLPGPVPPGRHGHAMALDPMRNRIVVFGGTGATQILNDTWEWNGAAWTQLAPSQSPPARFSAGFTFDPTSGQMLLYGGNTGFFSQSDTWRWNGVNWQQGPNGPVARHDFAMTHDPVAARVVVHGGRSSGTSGSSELTDTWEWNGSTWALVAIGSTISTKTAMAFDGEHVVLFGGVPPGGTVNYPSSTTLRLRRSAATASPYGSGCSAAWPAPQLFATVLPYVGDAAFSMTIANVPPDAHTWVAASNSAAAIPYGGGCTLLIGTPVGVLHAMASRAGVARHAVAIPNALSLVGMPFHWQGFALDPAGPAQGLSWSQGVRTDIGN